MMYITDLKGGDKITWGILSHLKDNLLGEMQNYLVYVQNEVCAVDWK